MQNRTHLIFSTLAMLIGMTLNVSFAAAEGVTKDIKSAKAGTYKVDPHHTQIVFTLNHLGFTNFTGTFSEASGSLELDPKNITNSKLQIIIPSKRIHFIKVVDGKVPNDYKSKCCFDCYYYCWKMNLDKDITFL